MFGEGRELDAENYYQVHCLGKSQCDIPIDLSAAGPFSKTCREVLKERRQASRYNSTDET